jgi:Xaa-Pro aminopeptidase
MQYEWGKRGCERPAYAPIVGSGYYSTVLHYSDDDNVMKSGDVVVIDAAGRYSMYASDITRTLPINGHFTARQREIYDIVLGAQQAADGRFPVRQIDHLARRPRLALQSRLRLHQHSWQRSARRAAGKVFHPRPGALRRPQRA